MVLRVLLNQDTSSYGLLRKSVVEVFHCTHNAGAVQCTVYLKLWSPGSITRNRASVIDFVQISGVG